MLSFLCYIVSAAAAAAQPKPVWPPTFSATFHSDYKKTNGNFTVSALQAASERIDMEDGTMDHLCSTVHNHTAWNQLTTAGFRYLYFPTAQPADCCKCCSYTHGNYECGGPLSPAWVSNETGNLLYLGRRLVNGLEADRWNSQGLGTPPHGNYYYQYVDSGLPVNGESTPLPIKPLLLEGGSRWTELP